MDSFDQAYNIFPVTVNVCWNNLNVQEHWSYLENLILHIVDELAPLTPFNENVGVKVKTIPPFVKNKINLRKRLLMLEKKRKCTELAPRIKLLSKLIGDYFANDKAARVRSAAMGSKVNLWKAVKVAKNVNCSSIPKNLTLGGVAINDGCVAESFAKIFHEKIKNNVQKSAFLPSIKNEGAFIRGKVYLR